MDYIYGHVLTYVFELTQTCRMMPQKPYFFNKTVMENIKYANQYATDEEVYDASHKAGLHESIMKRSGKYQSIVRANGE